MKQLIFTINSITYAVWFQTTKSTIVPLTTPSPTISVTKDILEQVSTETTVSVSVGSSSSIVSSDTEDPLPDIRVKIKSQDGARPRHNSTSDSPEVRSNIYEPQIYLSTLLTV